VDNLPKKLVVGSANFGTNYGAKNSRLSTEDAYRIVQDVSTNSNAFIETSESYQGAIKIIGEALGTRKFENIIIKVPPIKFSDEKSFMESVENSFRNLNQSKVYAIMLHGIGDSLSTSKLSMQVVLRRILKLNYSQKVGLSCYNVSEVVEAKDAFPEMEIFQIPENIADKRKYASPILKALSNDGVTFQIRSVFLQGLLISEDTSMNPRIEEIQRIRNDIEVLAKNQNINSAELCLRYGLSIDWASQIVIGFENYEHYRKNLEIITNDKPNISFEITKGSDFLVDPRNWS
jgi:aryl-alcohol dehydrogenase-like predicted oxidoreductase